ncbi:MAG: WXG100 family type VII secretion target [Anaerolineales bacterium]
MTRITVDPEQLAQAAQELAETAERLQRLADEAHAIGSSAPDYDGQFGPQVERLGLEALSALTSQSQRAGSLGDELLDISQAFAEADQQSQSGFGSVWSLLNGWKEKAEELLPSWFMSWLFRGEGLPNVQIGRSAAEGPRWPFLLQSSTLPAQRTPAPGATATPAPPGSTPEPRLAPTARWTPMPIGTPTAEEQQQIHARARAAAESEWQENFMDRLEWCLDSSDPDSCIVVVARTVYDQYDLDLDAMIEAKQDNLLSQDSAEFLYLSPIVLLNYGQDGNAVFLRSLNMDPGHISNYEPACLDALMVENPYEYVNALAEMEERREELDAWNDGYLNQLLDSPYWAMLEG